MQPRSYTVHAEDDDRHCRRLEGASFEEAAAAFASEWHPGEDEVTVIVIDDASGRRQCFRIDLASGDAGPCG